jgi:methylmalonyl-CoA mutase cobalamin-binding domain/chain
VPVARRRHTSVVVLAGDARRSDRGALALAKALGEAGIDIVYLGRENSARRIAESVADTPADAVEVCLAGGGGIALLRDLLRELDRLDRREVSIVVHRVD